MTRRIVSLTLCFLLALGTFSCASADVATLDGALSRWLEGNDQICLSAGFTLNAWEPFPTETLDLLNGVLKHMKANVWLENDSEASLTNVQLALDSTELFQLTERIAGTEASMELSLLPNRVLTTTGASPIDLLTADETAEARAFSMLNAVTEAQACYGALIDACTPFAEEKKASYKIKGIGTARFSKIARLTVEQSTSVRDQIAAVLGSGMDDAFCERLKGFTYAKGFIVALYQNADHQDIAVYMKGTMLDPDGRKYNLAYQWAFVNEGVKRKDAYKFDFKAASRPTDQRVVAASSEQSMFTDKFSFDAKTVTTCKSSEQTSVDTVTLALSGKKAADNALTIGGKVGQACKLTQNGDTRSDDKAVSLDLLLTPKDVGAVLSGTIGYTSTRDKTTLLDLTLTLAKDVPEAFASTASDQSLYSVTDAPESSLEQTLDALHQDDYLVGTAPIGLQAYTVPASRTTVALEQLDAAGKDALLAEAAQRLASNWLPAVSKLPDEDAALLKDGMTDEDYAKFLSLLDAF